MKILNLLCGVGSVLIAATAFSAEPNLTFDLNSGNASYRFSLENNTDADVTCKSIAIKADIGNRDCSEILSSYSFTMNNTKISKGDSILNAEFGIDYLHALNRKNKSKTLVYCHEPQVTINCN